MNNFIWNTQHLNRAMDDGKKLCNNKNYYNQNSMNGLFLILFMMVSMNTNYKL